MNTLKDLNLNFRNLENCIKTIGTITIILLSIALTINEFLNPGNFTL